MSTINLPPGVPAYQPVAAKTPTSPNAFAGSAKDIQDNFLKMLMAQIQNQNPMDPAKPSEFTSQLSQLNTMKGISDLNANVQAFLSQIKASDFMGLSQVVGRNALVAGSQFDFTGEPVVVGARLASDATDLRALIMNDLGQVVDEVSLGASRAGQARLQWDGGMKDGGSAPAGRYRIEFRGAAADGGNLSVSSLVASQVVSVGRDGDALQIRLADGRAVGSGDVIEWLK
ncbi:MAG: hypothetical protein RIR70_1146 [Pseudomonadota bacterium]|jgi:flagellar basal-body rod modification protein FlgD